MSDLVKNLRNSDWVKDWFDQAGFQAADRIEELEQLVAELRNSQNVQENRSTSSETKNLQSSSGFCPEL